MLRIAVIASGRNCHQYAEPFIQSLKEQTDQNFLTFLVDDGSDEPLFTGEVIGGIHKMRFDKRTGAFNARDTAIRSARLRQQDIIVMADLDDSLLPTAIERIRKEHESGKWMTYGTYIDNDAVIFNDLHFSDEIHRARNYRQDKWRCTHLRSFRLKLYDQIPQWKLTQSEIDSYPDAEILFSMMEMCGKERTGVIEEPIYRFNNHNPLSTLKVYGKDDDGYQEICNRPKREMI
jgi:glycosyltransferase involved in cell wall biosynthesis